MKGKLNIFIKEAIRKIVSKHGAIMLNKKRYDTGCLALARAIQEIIRYDQMQRSPGAHGIIFSKDRPLQLHGLLSSYFELSDNPPNLNVIYSSSSEDYKNAYMGLQDNFNGREINFIAENNFRETLIKCLERIRSEKIFFLVDDNVFIRPVDFSEYLSFDPSIQIPSLRLAPHLNYCYTLASKQPLPNFKEVGESVAGDKFLEWRWEDGKYDWGYPFSVDGNCFMTNEILAMTRLLEFSAPNSFEDALQWFKGLYACRKGVCYEKSRLINIPFNRVQSENNNLASDVSPLALLKLWGEGYEIDTTRYRDIRNRSAHQEMNLYLRCRSNSHV